MASLYAVLDSESVSTTGWHTRYKITFLGTLGGTFSQPFGINNTGEVDAIGNLPGDQSHQAFLWRDGVITGLASLGGPNNTGDFAC